MNTFKSILIVAILAIGSAVQAKSLGGVDSIAADIVAVVDEPVYDLADVEVKPEFPGGDKAMYEFMIKNLRYPADAQEEGAQGVVIVAFVIGKDGKLTDVKAVRTPHESLSKEAVRLVKSMPTWTPGKQNGQPVKVSYSLPIRFKLPKK